MKTKSTTTVKEQLLSQFEAIYIDASRVFGFKPKVRLPANEAGDRIREKINSWVDNCTDALEDDYDRAQRHYADRNLDSLNLEFETSFSVGAELYFHLRARFGQSGRSGLKRKVIEFYVTADVHHSSGTRDVAGTTAFLDLLHSVNAIAAKAGEHISCTYAFTPKGD